MLQDMFYDAHSVVYVHSDFGKDSNPMGIQRTPRILSAPTLRNPCPKAGRAERASVAQEAVRRRVAN